MAAGVTRRVCDSRRVAAQEQAELSLSRLPHCGIDVVDTALPVARLDEDHLLVLVRLLASFCCDVRSSACIHNLSICFRD